MHSRKGGANQLTSYKKIIITTTMAYPVIPVPEPMDMKGDTYNNLTFFRAQWENYEIATGLDKKEA